jgi:MarR family transcriptional regulator, transcriptional regulator for hemolysin
MSSTPRGRRSLGFLLRESSRLMRRRFVHHAREAGLPLNRSEASLLWQVFHEPGTNQAKVASELDIETITVVRLVDSLEEAGLIERRPHSADRRVRTLWLTAAGEEAAARIRAIADLVRAEALAGVPIAERQRLLTLLQAIRSNLWKASETARSSAA